MDKLEYLERHVKSRKVCYSDVSSWIVGQFVSHGLPVFQTILYQDYLKQSIAGLDM